MRMYLRDRETKSVGLKNSPSLTQNNKKNEEEKKKEIRPSLPWVIIRVCTAEKDQGCT